MKTTKAHFETEFAQRHLRAAIDAASQLFADNLESDLHGNVGRYEFDSPLEVAFWMWWEAMTQPGRMRLSIIPQKETVSFGRTYRVDFEVVPSHTFPPAGLRVAIELDGHGFHERTPEQVRARDARDRDLQEAGWRVLHVSFSEFDASPIAVIGGIYGQAWRIFEDAYEAARKG